MAGPTQAADIELDGVFNFRDLGGLATTDGRSTTSGLLFRSDGLHRSPIAQRGRLRDVGVERVVDLRTQAEIESEGRFEFDGIEWLHAPIVQQLTDFVGPNRPCDDVDLLCHHYEHMAAANAEAMAAAIELVADSVEAGPTVFHCTAGKDRTGVLTALILSGIGVTDDEVVADFARSSRGILAMIEWYRASSGAAPADRMAEMGLDASMAQVLMGAQAVTMESFLARRRAADGGLGGYLARIGIEASIDRIARQLLD